MMNGTPSGSSAAATAQRDQAPEPGPLRPFHFPEIHRRSLSNGLPILVAGVHHFPVVTLSMLVEAGGTYEAEPQAGVASLTAALLESGAGDRNAGEIAETMESLGADLDTGVSWDIGHAGLTALRSRLEPASEIFADVLRRPVFPRAEVERIRAERLAAIAQRRADPRGLANEMFARFVYSPDSPFARPLSGTTATVTGLTQQDVTAFHATHYVPRGAALIVVGDVSPDEAAELAERLFGD